MISRPSPVDGPEGPHYIKPNRTPNPEYRIPNTGERADPQFDLPQNVDLMQDMGR